MELKHKIEDLSENYKRLQKLVKRADEPAKIKNVVVYDSEIKIEFDLRQGSAVVLSVNRRKILKSRIEILVNEALRASQVEARKELERIENLLKDL